MILQILLYTLVTGILTLLAFIYFKLIRPQKRLYDIFRAQGINGESFVPLVGELLQFRHYRDADKMMAYHEDLVKKYGNVVLYSFGPLVQLLVNEPDMLADVLGRNSAQNYVKSQMTRTTLLPIVGKHNLLTTENHEHERARRMLNPAFHHINLKSLISIMSDRTTKTIDSLITKLNSDQEKQQQFNLQNLFNGLTLSVIVASAFGSDLETNTNAKDIMCRLLSEALDATMYRSMNMINQIPLLTHLPFWQKQVVDNGGRAIREFVDQVIIDRRQGRCTSMSDGPDILDLLISAVDDEGQPFTDQEIRDQALTFVFAGSETTGNLMVWIFYILMMHEDVLHACQEEVDRVLPNGIEPSHDHLTELVVCEAIINETLRLYPPAPFLTRHCIREHMIGTERQIYLPAGSVVFINSYILHRRSDLWPRPLEFDYTRWMRDPKTGLKPKLAHPFAYIPFGAGPRNCIGQNFALLEAKIILSMFVQRFNFELIPGQKIVPDVKLTMRTRYGLFVNIRKRQI